MSEPAASGAERSAVSVLVVDDSFVLRRFLRSVIDSDPRLCLAGEAVDGLAAIAAVPRLLPDVVVMDVDLPGLDGCAVIRQIMARRPTPILVYAALPPDRRAAAIEAGAADVLSRPGPRDGGRLDEYMDELRRRLLLLGQVRLLEPAPKSGRSTGRRVPPGAGRKPAEAAPAGRTPAADPPAPPRPPKVAAAPMPPSRPGSPAPSGRPRAARAAALVAVGASTGGPAALAALLRELPADFPVPVLVVQHMADGFIDGLADWLGLMCRLPVVVARAGERLRPGTVAVAPNGVNVMLDDELRVVTEPAPPRQYHVPAIDVAFVSVAQRLGPDAIGVLLTGMGRDGAVGLRAMHDRGASTFVQDPESCAVYGMPAAAVALHAADAQLPPREIARELRRLVAARRLGSRRGS